MKPCVPLLAGIRVGVGCGQKPHRAQVSSLGQKGQEKRRATGKGEGWRKDGELRACRGLHRGGWCTAQQLPLLSAQSADSAHSNGQGAGHRPPRFSEVAGILAKEVSAQAQPPQRQHLEPHLSLHPTWSLPQVPEGRGGRGILVGSRDRLGGGGAEEEEGGNTQLLACS